jgi:murein DD-endopeptidase
MKLRWERIMALERRQFADMTEEERFAYFLSLQVGSPYGWGMENPRAADCSGSVQLALAAATGFLVRTTADELYRKIFTNPAPGRNAIRAVFFITLRDVRHGSGLAVKGTAIHTAGLVGDGVVLNFQEPKAIFRSLEELSRLFGERECRTEVRGLDRDALARAAGQRAMVYGLDPELAEFFEGDLYA